MVRLTHGLAGRKYAAKRRRPAPQLVTLRHVRRDIGTAMSAGLIIRRSLGVVEWDSPGRVAVRIILASWDEGARREPRWLPAHVAGLAACPPASGVTRVCASWTC